MNIKRISAKKYQELVSDDAGYCWVCRKWLTDFCEPDLQRAKCPRCGNDTAWGIEEALIAGLIYVKEQLE
jgi:hypothetical protein